MSAEAKIAELGLQLPEAPKPGGNYTPVVQIGDLCYVSGHGPLTVEGTMLTGRVGSEVSQEDGYAAARQVGLTMLATLRAEVVRLDLPGPVEPIDRWLEELDDLVDDDGWSPRSRREIAELLEA